jgi:hypothetical protein
MQTRSFIQKTKITKTITAKITKLITAISSIVGVLKVNTTVKQFKLQEKSEEFFSK